MSSLVSKLTLKAGKSVESTWPDSMNAMMFGGGDVFSPRKGQFSSGQVQSGNSFPVSEFEVNVGGNGQTSYKVSEEGRLTIRTGCDPKQFKETVVALTSKRSRSLTERIIGMWELNSSKRKVPKKCSDGKFEKGSAGQSDDLSTCYDSPISEDIKTVSEISGVKSDVWKVSSMLDNLESKLDILGSKICEVKELVVIMKAGDIKCIVFDVIETVKSIRANAIVQGSLDFKEEIDAHDYGSSDSRETFESKEVRKIKDLFRFPVPINLSQKDLKILNFLFCKGREGVDESCVEVSRFGENCLSRGDIQCLLPRTPLSSKVINIFATYLSEEDPNSWFLPTYFGKRASSKDDAFNIHTSIVSTITECGLHRFYRRLKRCCQIFIPLHDDNAEHWYLLVVRLHEKVAEIWDSQRENGSLYERHEKARYAISLLQKIFYNDMTRRGDVYYNFELFPVVCPDVFPIIYKNFDSGIYIIRQMQRYPQDWFETFDSNEQRTLIALEIVNNLTNKVVESVNAGAKDHKGCNCFGKGTSKSSNHIPRHNDWFKKCGVPIVNCVDTHPTGRKWRSHRKRRAAV